VGLIQSVVEQSGIPTVSVSILPEVTRKVSPPRVLVVDAPLGYPLGKDGDPEVQRRLVVQMLGLAEVPAPVIRAAAA